MLVTDDSLIAKPRRLVTAEEAVSILRTHADALRNLGIVHAAIFGSAARGEAQDGSDLDILVELDPGQPIDIVDLAWIATEVQKLFPMRVDVVEGDPKLQSSGPERIVAF